VNAARRRQGNSNNLSLSTYLWLPLTFDGKAWNLSYSAQWSINLNSVARRRDQQGGEERRRLFLSLGFLLLSLSPCKIILVPLNLALRDPV
jgi:hypothetical protein